MRAKYKDRTVRKWLDMLAGGALVLPSFQRSYVWRNAAIVDYLVALFRERPTGMFLILGAGENGHLPFDSRTIHGAPAESPDAYELVLDGQQRLTGLWRALTASGNYRFYVQVNNAGGRDLSVTAVKVYGNQTTQGRRCRKPGHALEANLIPVDILCDLAEADSAEEGLGPIWEWCYQACDADARRIGALHKAIEEKLAGQLMKHELHYCQMPTNTAPRVAIDVFVKTNQSSVKIKEFDLAVALARRDHDANLRERIRDAWKRYPEFRHYFGSDEQKYIPMIGEWVLKVACLKMSDPQHPDGVIPKQSNYQKALSWLFDTGTADGKDRIDGLLNDLAKTLEFVRDEGIASRKALPGWPPVHVVAALWEAMRPIQKPVRKGAARNLRSAYLWRAFCGRRYSVQANDRLFKDFRAMRRCMRQIADTGRVDRARLPEIFDDKRYPMPDLHELKKEIGWIGRGRQGPAIAAVVMHDRPLDWVMPERLDTAKARALEADKELHRHHVFPKDALRGRVPQKAIDSAMNGVVLAKPTNLTFAKKDPREYLEYVLDSVQGLTKQKLEKRVESHFVPYDTLVGSGSLEERFEEFRDIRAKRVAKRIRELTTFDAEQP